MSKKMLSMSIATVAVLGLASLAMAQGWGGGYGGHMMNGYGGQMMRGGGYGYGPMMGADNVQCPGWGAQGAALTPEQAEQAKTLWTEHLAKVQPLGRELQAKNAELNAALLATTIDSDRVDALAKEVGDLRTKLFTEQISLRKALRDAGLPTVGMGFGRGMGQGFRHMGQGFGPGMGRHMGPGYGMGYDADDRS